MGKRLGPSISGRYLEAAAIRRWPLLEVRLYYYICANTIEQHQPSVNNSPIGLLTKTSSFTNRNTLNMLCKMHVRCHLDYGDMIYHDQLCSTSKLLESIQYNTGCWKGTNKLKLYTELGWESLSKSTTLPSPLPILQNT